MKSYYGHALYNGFSIAEKLTCKNGGGFCWVSNYNTGFYSSTNFVYPDGTTNQLNTALVQSCDIDSDGDGIVNCQDQCPTFPPNPYCNRKTTRLNSSHHTIPNPP